MMNDHAVHEKWCALSDKESAEPPYSSLACTTCTTVLTRPYSRLPTAVPALDSYQNAYGMSSAQGGLDKQWFQLCARTNADEL